ncbi:MAG: D-2-hydroxyacid dehydrogenase [Caldilineaceae bacterium]|nr:D-2-hydroxyacid dehydrogenase [Caldilineaceae bacterium]
MNFLIFPPLTPDELEQVRAVSPDLEIVNALTEDEALAAIPQAVGMYGDLTPALLERAESLRWLQTPIAGLEHYMFAELAESDIVVSNMAKIYSDMIADHAFCFILMFARGIHLYMRRQIRGEWQKGTPVRHLADCTLGVIGLGGIGSELARRGKAHDMRVIAVDARPASTPGRSLDLDALWPQDRLHDLLGEADFAVSCVPQTPETVGLIGAEEIGKMKSSAYLINISRGVVVKLDALVAALESGGIAGAALDVYETEPLPAEHPLWKMENVILTPHVAADNPHVPQRRIDTLRDNLRRYLAGEPVRNIVDKRRLF